jgi:hypothetical protein
VRYTLTVDPDVALLGMSFPNEQDAAFAAAVGFTPLSAEDMRRLRGGAASRRERQNRRYAAAGVQQGWSAEARPPPSTRRRTVVSACACVPLPANSRVTFRPRGSFAAARS